MIYLELFLTFLKIGAFTFGGGYAMLPLIQQNVLALGWATEQELINFIAVAESTPGPFAINMATYIGSECGGILGSLCATLGVVLPSFIIILIVAKFYMAFRENKYVAGCMSGLRPAVVGLIGTAVISIGKTVFFPDGFTFSAFTSHELYVSAGIFISMILLQKKKLSPIVIIGLSAVMGIIFGYILN